MTANWAFAPVCGVDFWRVIVISPEVFIFLFFMITDPRTVPAGRVGRILFGSLVAVVGTLLLATQTTEFGAKVGLLTGLVVMCAVRPIFDRLVPQPNSVKDDPRQYLVSLSGLAGARARFDVMRARSRGWSVSLPLALASSSAVHSPRAMPRSWCRCSGGRRSIPCGWIQRRFQRFPWTVPSPTGIPR